MGKVKSLKSRKSCFCIDVPDQCRSYYHTAPIGSKPSSGAGRNVNCSGGRNCICVSYMVHNGIWDKGLSQREALWRDFLTSVICAGIFSVLYGICLGRMGATEKQTIYLSLLFLGGITIVAFIVLRVLSYFNRKRRWISVNGEQRDIPTSKLGCTKIYNAKDIVEAGRIVELLKEHGIAAFSQEAVASVSMHGASGFGMYGMDVLVETDEVKRALQIIEVADDSQGSEKF